jgi:hypothetical protein
LKRVIGFVEDGNDDRSGNWRSALTHARRIHQQQKIVRAPHVVFQFHRRDSLRVRRPSAIQIEAVFDGEVQDVLADAEDARRQAHARADRADERALGGDLHGERRAPLHTLFQLWRLTHQWGRAARKDASLSVVQSSRGRKRPGMGPK